MSSDPYDYVVIGSGVGGLCTAALLARSGQRVCVLERHYKPGGYGHSFAKGDYTFCAQLHYLWNCGPEEDFGQLLRHLGLQDEITFAPLDPDGFDRLNFPSFRYDIVKGFERNAALLSARYPAHGEAIARYFRLITQLNHELLQMPVGFGISNFLRHPLKFWNVIRYRNWTTADLFDRLGLPLELRSILAGQSGDLLLPPSKASLLVQAALACGYDAGACVPTRSYEHLFDTLVEFINSQPGCRVFLTSWVKTLEEENGRITAARTNKGVVYSGRQFIYNGDPRLLDRLTGRALPRSFRRRLSYDYSPSNFTLYLGLRDLDLAAHGFGNWNVWHYPHDDLDQCYRQQLDERRMDNPTLFLSTPTLHHKDAAIAPPGCHQMIVCTMCDYNHFAELQAKGRQFYLEEKERIKERMLDQIERHYIPHLRQHLDIVVAGTPTTNERFVLAPHGNSYGANLTPAQINVGKIDHRSPFPNLHLVGASAGVPSFAGGVHYAILLYEHLTDDTLPRSPYVPPRPRFGGEGLGARGLDILQDPLTPALSPEAEAKEQEA